MPTTERLARAGDVETITRVRRWRECEVCGRPARWEVTYLYLNARHNPASKGYHKDDISRCKDAERYLCGRHGLRGREDDSNNAPEGMETCAWVPLKNFRHRGFFWETCAMRTTRPPREGALQPTMV